MKSIHTILLILLFTHSLILRSQEKIELKGPYSNYLVKGYRHKIQIKGVDYRKAALSIKLSDTSGIKYQLDSNTIVLTVTRQCKQKDLRISLLQKGKPKALLNENFTIAEAPTPEIGVHTSGRRVESGDTLTASEVQNLSSLFIIISGKVPPVTFYISKFTIFFTVDQQAIEIACNGPNVSGDFASVLKKRGTPKQISLQNIQVVDNMSRTIQLSPVIFYVKK